MEKTGALAAIKGCRGHSPIPKPMSESRSPRPARTARSTIGTPVIFDKKGTVREPRGFTSITYTVPSNTTYWMLNRPRTPSARPRSVVWRTIVSINSGDSDCAGYRAMLSPECTPARSTCSMIPGISTSDPSQIASTSISAPSRYLSTSNGFLPEISLATAANSRNSAALRQISMARPPSTNDGRTRTGYPSCSASDTASEGVATMPPGGCGIPR